MTGQGTATTRGIFTPELLERCISCGFCLAACPTYALTGDEQSSPRGRINLMRALEGGILEPDDPTLQEQASFCLGCRACEPVCPAGVRYGTLLQEWRVHQWRGRHRPVLVRAISTLVALRSVVRAMGIARRPARATRQTTPGGPALMLGCFERVLFPSVSRSLLRLAPDLTVPGTQGCCGALAAHNGDLAAGERLARQLGRDLPGLIVTTSGGCAAHIAQVLGRTRVREASEYLLSRPLATPAGPTAARPRVTLQDSCHLRNGLGVYEEPRELLRGVADYVEVEGAGTCCGAAGSYSLLRPRDSRRVLGPKLDAIEAADVDFVVAVNPVCLRQLKIGLRRRQSPVQAIHLVDFLTLSHEGRPAQRRLSRWASLARSIRRRYLTPPR